MRTRDFIYAGAFCAIYLVLMLIIVMGSSMISPLLYFMAPLTVGLIGGTVYMLYVLKVHKFGAALILGALFALIACAQSWYGVLFALTAALSAELILFLGKYKSRIMYLISFVFNLTMAAPTLMILWTMTNSCPLQRGIITIHPRKRLPGLPFTGKYGMSC